VWHGVVVSTLCCHSGGAMHVSTQIWWVQSIFCTFFFFPSTGLICRDQSSILKFRLAPIFLSKNFEINLNQKLNISAKDFTTGLEQKAALVYYPNYQLFMDGFHQDFRIPKVGHKIKQWKTVLHYLTQL
jgi:hypothetical protein